MQSGKVFSYSNIILLFCKIVLILQTPFDIFYLSQPQEVLT